MGDGDADAEEPAGRRPLPPEDRVWRHPAEVAMDTRRAVTRRRARRLKAGAAMVGGALAVSGVVWISRAGPTDIDLVSDQIRLGVASDSSAATVATVAATVEAEPEAVFAFQEPDDSMRRVIVRSTATGEALAGALMIGDGFVVTSGVALAGADDVLVTWDDKSLSGEVVGQDAVTDISVIRVDGAVPDVDLDDARVNEGDEINMSTEDGSRSVHRVVAEQSTSAMANGLPLVGIVELDGRLGDVPPGSPAYDINGDVVGITTATADSAPAAIVPIELARQVADEIIATGEATHPWLGVKARNPDDGDRFDQPGSLVTAVTVDGPAAAGGVIAGDLIVLIDGRAVDSLASMVATLRSYEPGDVVDIVVWREDREISCTVELASHLDVEA